MSESLVYDETGAFTGHQGTRCGAHRTVGSHRAWCHDCGEWCYPNDSCHGCRQRIELICGECQSYLGELSMVQSAEVELSFTCPDCGSVSHRPRPEEPT